MQVRSVAAIPLSHPLEKGRSFGHARGLTDARSATGTLEEALDPTDGSLSVQTAPGPGVTVDGDPVERYRVGRR